MFKRVKRGDTLVEVALAVGVFSMVAVAVTAVLNGSTSGAQTALETTTTREEIDTQAEALRFIQTAYAISRNDTEDNKYRELWKAITGKAVENISDKSDSDKDKILNYTPTTCSELYSSSNPYYGNMFILNPRKLSNFTKDTVNEVFLATDSGKLKTATINPRLVYSGSTAAANAEDQDRLVDTSTSDALFRAEGIFIVPVKDPGKTSITDIVDGKISETVSAYYDFYIRSCWYGTGADHPSTISTLVRLYDPDVMQGGGTVTVIYSGAFASDSDAQAYDYMKYSGITYPTYGRQGPYRKVVLREVSAPPGWTFNWIDSSGEPHKSGAAITNDVVGTNKIYNLDANYTHTKYRIDYDLNYPYEADASTISSMAPRSQDCFYDKDCKVASASGITSSGYKIKGWCSVKVSANNTCPASARYYDLGSSIPNMTTTPFATEAQFKTNFPNSVKIDDERVSAMTLYAIWSEQNETITIKATWTSNTDYDTYISGSKSNGSGFSAYYGSLAPSETVNGTTRILAQLDHDGRGSGSINDYFNETFTINTLGGKAYYYYIRNWRNPGTLGSDIRITVSGPEMGTRSFSSTSRSSCEYWNVFAYKDGAITERNTCSSSPETSY